MPTNQHLTELQSLIDTYGQEAVERALNVHRTTITRWLTCKVRMPEHARYVAQELAGNLPGTNGRWPGWRFWRGELMAPDGRGYAPHEITSVDLKDGLIGALRRENDELRAKLTAKGDAKPAKRMA